MKKWLGSVMLLIAAFIWGLAFVAQSVGMDYVGPLTFSFSRYLVGALVLIPVLVVSGFIEKKKEYQLTQKEKANRISKEERRRNTLTGGLLCGCLLFAASILQQYGIAMIEVGKAGFITALYIILVPIIGIFIGKKTSIGVWVCAAIAVVGLFLLCMDESFQVQAGDWLVFLCAILFSIHIRVVDYYSPKGNGIAISCIQFFVCTFFSFIGMFLFEKPQLQAILSAYLPILFTGVLSSGVAYTFQILGQKYVEPTKASLIMCLESPISALGGWLLLKEVLSLREWMGCLVVFIAILFAQLPKNFLKRKKSE